MACLEMIDCLICDLILFLLNNIYLFIFIPIFEYFFYTYCTIFFSRLNMNREELLELIKQKDEIEKELSDLANELQSQNNVGMTEELVDREGYPR